MEGQIALGFHQKHFNLCSEDERRSYGFGTTWGWVINARIFILGWTNPLMFVGWFCRCCPILQHSNLNMAIQVNIQNIKCFLIQYMPCFPHYSNTSCYFCSHMFNVGFPADFVIKNHPQKCIFIYSFHFNIINHYIYLCISFAVSKQHKFSFV